MFRRLRTWFLSLRDSIVADQADEIRSQSERVASLVRQCDELSGRLQSLKHVRDQLLKLIDALWKGIDFPAEAVDESWKETPAAAMHAVGAHVDRMRAADVRRADEAESTANDLRAEINQLQRQLEAEKRAHEATRHEKKCTEAENRLLSKIHEVDVQRRQAELSVLVRQQVEAEAGVQNLQADDGD
jgi:hypothetical protein